jgi:hypothetical protein
MKFHEICKNLRKNILLRKNLGAIYVQESPDCQGKRKKKKKRLGAGSPTNGC